MRRAFGWFWVVVTAILIAAVGTIAYQAGWSAGFAQHVPEGVAAMPYPYYYGPHLDFGWLFGLLFFLFILFALTRMARFGRWGHGGWGHRGFPGSQHPGGLPQVMDERMREWHQRAHGEQPAAPPPPPSPPASGQSQA
jgi:hypothetical protein